VSTIPCRLWGILARDAARAAILRRGPSQWVQVILWHTDTDTFEYGQWFHGRIREYGCDLSPDGSLLIYCASKYNAHTLRDTEYTSTWTAISKPPYLTALALWPKRELWDGGGLFVDAQTVKLNHDPAFATPHPDHRPHGLKIITWPLPEGQVVRHFLNVEQMQRDGWQLVDGGTWPSHAALRRPRRVDAIRPTVWQKTHPSGHYRLRRTVVADDRDHMGGSSVDEFAIEEVATSQRTSITDATWAEWDQQGRLVFARAGQIYAWRLDDHQVEETMLVDLNGQRFYRLAAPAWAQEW